MIIKAIKTRKFLPPQDDLWELLSAIKNLQENSIVCITSKVVSIGEGGCLPVSGIDKDELIKKESDKYLSRKFVPQERVMYTIKNNMLVASAGIDESNGNNFYILWPKNPNKSAEDICLYLKNKFKLNNLGVVITDSRLIPLRQGVVGYSIGYFGFKPIKDYRGKEDLFGRKLVMETSNLPDSLATAAVLEMGEGSEGKPFAVITNLSNIEFINSEYKPATGDDSFDINESQDVFYPFLSSVQWGKGGSGKS